MYSPAQELSSIAFDKIIGGALDAVIQAQSNSAITTVNFIRNTGFRMDENGNITDPIYVSFKYPKEIQPYTPARPAYCALRVVKGGKGYTASAVKEFLLNGNAVNVRLEIDENGTITGAELLTEIAGGIEDNSALTLTLVDGQTVKEECEITAYMVAAQEATPAIFQNMEISVPILTMIPVPFIRVASTDIEFNVKINSMNTSNTENTSSNNVTSSNSVGYKGFGVTANVSLNASVSSQKKSSSTEEVKKEFSLNIKVHAVQDEMPAGLNRILDILEETIVPRVSA